ncbi:GTP-binding protein [Methanocella sp. CWC-04]|uniref:GTP-binding protein n=1 Tax=Methanooceanicella nereidis TaxID=2052831 RepID=A0AAP2W7C4_9EURY|nr:GTP-binding protein [Methanocella sp. CWC-04]MCD1296277.1 GTP-binding protein [Methanocella sp. CWC-04]
MILEHSNRINVHDNQRRVKVVAFGSYHSGKTSFIKRIDPDPLLTEARNHDGTTTVALDMGIRYHKGYKLYVYGTPGQERFEVAREVVAFGLNAGLVVVDSTRGMTEFEKRVLSELRGSGIPCIVLANKSDLPGASVEKVREDAGGYDDVFPISSVTGKGVDAVLDRIVELASALRSN